MLIRQILSATGHRPDKLGGYGAATDERCVRLANDYLSQMIVERVISGMALGWDLAWAEAALGLGIPVRAAVPFPGQEAQWPNEEINRYHAILDRCEDVTYVSGGFQPGAYQRRNEWMVDNSDGVVALWDGSSGGTSNCVRYAQRRDKLMVNLWSKYNE